MNNKKKGIISLWNASRGDKDGTAGEETAGNT